MKLKLSVLTMALSFCLIVIACNFSNSTTIIFENNSDKFIDSAVIYIQNYKIELFKIEPHTTYKKQVSKESIHSNQHDIMIRVYLYDNAKSDFQGGLYYNDLSGSLNDSYILTLDKNLITLIKPK